MPDPLAIIAQRESGNRNVRNYKYGPGFTASGYFQITNPTWARWAKAAGIDLSQYPTAESAPYDVQRAVAAQGYQQEGFKPWLATKHLVGQESNYSLEPRTQVAGVLGNESPVSGTGAAVPVTVQRAKDIDEFRSLMSAKFPELQYTSGYRSPSANKAAGGAKGSQHMHNRAVDARLKDFDDAKRAEIYNYARSIGAQGIGYYPNSQSAHFDLRQGAPAAWGQNYSRTSLGGTPGWYQNIAKAHLSGAAIPSTAVASGGSGGGTSGGAGVGGQPAQSPAPAPATPMDNISGGLTKIAQALAGPPIRPPAAPIADAPEPMPAPGGPTAPLGMAPPDQPQNSAASLMATLLDRKRSQYLPDQPGIFQTGVFG